MARSADGDGAADGDLLRQVARRRTFAIISHPDAGKTTLTEKFLLYAGAVQEAGAVKSRKAARTAVSDWMALEQQRGISITSTVLGFDYAGWRFNLLDTPGHADFSEDTYRTLHAADAAVMVLDNAKGLEPQTLKLFRVCADRGIPIVTFVNKCDRPGLPPLQILDEVAEQIGMVPVPLAWPVGDGLDFAGIVDRRRGELVRFDRTAHGATVGAERRVSWAEASPDGCPLDRWQAAADELELLDLEQIHLDRDAFLAGRHTPVFFGSALANFGVRMLLEGFAELAPAPAPQPIDGGAGRRAVDAPFSALVFKVQANMDPNHRDRVAFLRVQSGRFRRGMTAQVARNGRPFQLKYAHQLFAAERETLEEAVPGDIVGVTGAGGLQVGDTLYDPDGPPVAFPPIPSFAPERFAHLRNRDSSRYKQFRKGLAQLEEEGVVYVLRRPDLGDQQPILAGVGQLQFEVAAWRLTTEFGAEVTVEPAPWQLARRIDPAQADRLAGQRGTQVVKGAAGTVVLFRSHHALQWATQDHPDLELIELGVAPQTPEAVGGTHV
jgi:peptide chain release factor 3